MIKGPFSKILRKYGTIKLLKIIKNSNNVMF